MKQRKRKKYYISINQYLSVRENLSLFIRTDLPRCLSNYQIFLSTDGTQIHLKSRRILSMTQMSWLKTFYSFGLMATQLPQSKFQECWKIILFYRIILSFIHSIIYYLLRNCKNHSLSMSFLGHFLALFRVHLLELESLFPHP